MININPKSISNDVSNCSTMGVNKKSRGWLSASGSFEITLGFSRVLVAQSLAYYVVSCRQ